MDGVKDKLAHAASRLHIGKEHEGAASADPAGEAPTCESTPCTYDF